MRIEDFARLTGIASSTLRHYEQMGLLPPVRRNSDTYHADVFRFMRALQYVQQTGLTLDDIRAYLYDESIDDWQLDQSVPVDSHETLATHLENMKQHLARALLGPGEGPTPPRGRRA